MLGKIQPAPASVSRPAAPPHRTSFVIRLALGPKTAAIFQVRSRRARPFRLVQHGSASGASVRIGLLDCWPRQARGRAGKTLHGSWLFGEPASGGVVPADREI